MNKRKITILSLIIILSCSMTALAANFDDIGGHWAESEINRLHSAGVVSGVSKNEFKPDEAVTRAQFLKMIMEITSIQTASYRENECLDAKADDWYCDYLQGALDKGLIPKQMITAYKVEIKESENVDGTKVTRAVYSGAFNSDVFVTREEMAVLTQNAYQYMLNAATMNKLLPASEDDFADEDEISRWALQSVMLACGQRFIEGMDDNKFEPKSFTTRAQAAVVIGRVMDKK